MIEATILRARLRDLARLGRFRLAQAGRAGPRKPCASRRRPGADASSMAAEPSTRSKRAGSRPAPDNLMAATIQPSQSEAA
jgi:hypothetical protein